MGFSCWRRFNGVISRSIYDTFDNIYHSLEFHVRCLLLNLSISLEE